MTWTAMRAAAGGAAALVLLACGGGGDAATGPTPTEPVASVALEPATIAVAAGRTASLAATVRDARGAALTGRAVSWRSSAPAVATVDAAGLVTGVAAGTATVTATSEGRSADALVTVAAPQPAGVASVTLTPPTATLRVGDSLTLAAVARDAHGAALAGRAVRFASGAPAVATVDSATGVVRAVAAGRAAVTASSEGRTAEATITVVAPVATVAVGAAPDTLEAHDVVRLSATLRDAGGSVLADRVVRWTSSDPAVAAVDSVSGQLTGIDRGTVTVTATSEGKTGTATRVVVIRYRSVVTGTMHACDIASGGIAWCWGLGGPEGRLGDGRAGETERSASPVRVSGAVRFTQLSAFARHTCGLATDGRAYCWGYNGWGQLGDGTSADRPAPVPVGGGLTFRAIAVGAEHSCGLTADGRAHCWGNNGSGQLGTGGTAGRDAPQPVNGGLAVAAIALGSFTTCAATTSDAAHCWGNGAQGLLGAPAAGPFATAPHPVAGGIAFRSVSVGNVHACGVAADARGYCWGANAGRLGDGGGDDAATPRAVAGGLAWRAISAGYAHSCGVTTDGQAWCWGQNGFGQLGTGDASPSARPARVQGIGAVQEVSAAGVGGGQGGHTCAISADRLTTWCWGLNDVGQLGGGATTPASTPNARPAVVRGQRPLPAAR